MDTADIFVSTISRQRVSLLDPDPRTISLGDIAASLARQCRYNGHVEGFYSVAEHSVYVSRLIERAGHHPKVQMAGLLHDAHEAYIGDITQPVKALLERAAPSVIRHLEERLDRAICARFGLTYEHLKMVKPFDVEAYNEEMRTVRWDPQVDTACHISDARFVQRFCYLQEEISRAAR